MIVLGLTGSIGMGKSTAAATLANFGLPVFDSDRTVHDLLARGGGAVERVAEAFGDVVTDGRIDRTRLGTRVFADPAALARLEAILHPMVRTRTLRFLRLQSSRRAPLAVLDIPLLYETKGEVLCDRVAVVSTRAFLQTQRCLSRGGMTQERLAGIRAQQMPDREKRHRADFVIETGLDKRYTRCQLWLMVDSLLEAPARGRGRWRRWAKR